MTLGLVSRSWTRVAFCRSCDVAVFDANNPPPSATCPRCGDSRFEIENVQLGEVAGGLRAAASGDAGASHGCSLAEQPA